MSVGRRISCMECLGSGSALIAIALLLPPAAHAQTHTCRQTGTTSHGILSGPLTSAGLTGDLGTPVQHGNTLYFTFGDVYEPYYGDPNDDVLATTTPLAAGPAYAPSLTWASSAAHVRNAAGRDLEMGWGRTPLSSFSTRGTATSGGARWESYHRGLAYAVCNSNADCGGEGLTCDANLGTFDTPVLDVFGTVDICYRPAPGMGNGAICFGDPNAGPCFLLCGQAEDMDVPGAGPNGGTIKTGVCRDATSPFVSSTHSTAHAMAKSAAERIEIGVADGTGSINPSITWVTNKFINHHMRAVRYFDPSNPGNSDFRPPNGGAASDVHVLIWGRPHFTGNTAVNAPAKMYFAYTRNPDVYGWDPQYFCGGTENAPLWCPNQTDAVAIEQGEDNIPAQHSLTWSQTLQKWVMIYGGNLVFPVTEMMHPQHNGFASAGPASSTLNRIYYKTASKPWGTWSSKITIYDKATDPAQYKKFYDPAGPGWPTAMFPYQLTPGQEQEPGHPYGMSIVEPWSDGAPAADQVLTDIYFMVSTWNPYGAQLFSSRIGTGTPKTRTSAFYSNWFPHGFTFPSGTWSGGGDRITLTGNIANQRAVFNGGSYNYFTDYRFEIDVYPQDNDVVGLMARYTNSNNYYLMSADKNDGDTFTHVYRVKNGVKTEISNFSWMYTQNQWARWGIEVDGPVIRGYIDGVQRFQTIDSDPLMTGYAGMYGDYMDGARFDNMRIDACK